jgi:hypothetical protein
MADTAPQPAGSKTAQESTVPAAPAHEPALKWTKTTKALALAGIFAASAAVPGPVGMPARGLAGAIAEAPGMVYMLHKDEPMYLSNPEYDVRSHTWSVKAVPYSNADYKNEGIRLTVKPSLLNQAWSSAKGQGLFRPDVVVAPIAPMPRGTRAEYKVTYHGTVHSLFEAGPKDGVLLAVNEVPPGPKTARSGIPFAWPPGTWDKAFSPF